MTSHRGSRPAPRVRAAADSVAAELPSGTAVLPLRPLPPPLVEWLLEGRRAAYRAIAGEPGGPAFFAQHLPAVVTWGGDDPFPVHCGNKGVGFLPRPDLLGEATARYGEVLERTQGLPWSASVAARVEAVEAYTLDPDRLDLRCLGSLEIFEGATFRALRRNPLASLLYTGQSPRYASFQLNCAVEVVDEDDPRHAFLRLSRQLFEYDGFHIAQDRFRYAYLFWVSEVRDKTPHHVGRRPHLHGDPLPWEREAERGLAAVPDGVRDHVRRRVDAYARDRGFEQVSTALFREAREAFRVGTAAGPGARRRREG